MITVKCSNDAKWNERHVGTESGLSRGYVWKAANGHSQEMTNADAAALYATPENVEFVFVGITDAPAAEADTADAGE